jgi:hypothetical protein
MHDAGTASRAGKSGQDLENGRCSGNGEEMATKRQLEGGICRFERGDFDREKRWNLPGIRNDEGARYDKAEVERTAFLAGCDRSAGRVGRLSVDFRGELCRGKAADQMIEVGSRMHHRGNDLENQPTQREPGTKPMPYLGARDHCSD